MKLLLSLLVLASCSSNRHIPVTPYAAVPGHSYEMVIKGKGEPTKCIEHSTTKYCKLSGSVMVFRNGIFQESLAPLPEPMTYAISRDGLSMGGKYERVVYVQPGRKSLNPDGIEWRRHYPMVKTVLENNGYKVVSQLKDSKQLLKVNFGIKNGTKVTRYLNLTSYDSEAKLKLNREIENWKINVASAGTTRDLGKIFPILLIVADDFLKEPINNNSYLSLNDNQLEVVAFKHFYNVK